MVIIQFVMQNLLPTWLFSRVIDCGGGFNWLFDSFRQSTFHSIGHNSLMELFGIVICTLCILISVCNFFYSVN